MKIDMLFEQLKGTRVQMKILEQLKWIRVQIDRPIHEVRSDVDFPTVTIRRPHSLLAYASADGERVELVWDARENAKPTDTVPLFLDDMVLVGTSDVPVTCYALTVGERVVLALSDTRASQLARRHLDKVLEHEEAPEAELQAECVKVKNALFANNISDVVHVTSELLERLVADGVATRSNGADEEYKRAIIQAVEAGGGNETKMFRRHEGIAEGIAEDIADGIAEDVIKDSICAAAEIMSSPSAALVYVKLFTDNAKARSSARFFDRALNELTLENWKQLHAENKHVEVDGSTLEFERNGHRYVLNLSTQWLGAVKDLGGGNLDFGRFFAHRMQVRLLKEACVVETQWETVGHSATEADARKQHALYREEITAKGLSPEAFELLERFYLQLFSEVNEGDGSKDKN